MDRRGIDMAIVLPGLCPAILWHGHRSGGDTVRLRIAATVHGRRSDAFDWRIGPALARRRNAAVTRRI